MSDNTSLPLFLASVIGLSLSGVMMPGPVTAVTIANGAGRKGAGVLVAVGHGMIELPLMVLIYFGFAYFLKLTGVRIAVGLAGGVVLIWMALQVFQTRPVSSEERRKYPAQGPVAAGLVTTATNPYFYVWWATIGAALLADAHTFGRSGVVAMGAVHWVCDAAWLLLISWVAFKSKRLWSPVVHQVVFAACALVMAGFGAWFIVSSIRLAIAG